MSNTIFANPVTAFHSKPHVNLLVVLTEVIKKVSQIYPLGSMNVCTNIHFNSANSYGYIYIYKKNNVKCLDYYLFHRSCVSRLSP